MNKPLFRAWNPSDKVMVYDGFYINQATGLCHYVEEAVRASEITQERQVFLYDCGEEEPILMQCIGFVDVNKKLIWEGDIIYHPGSFGCISGSGTFTDTMHWKRIVIWDEKDLCFKTDFVDENMRGKGASGYTLCQQNCEQDFLVIGNIYENEQLLSDTTDKWRHLAEYKKYVIPQHESML